jgi:hypothetical protein
MTAIRVSKKPGQLDLEIKVATSIPKLPKPGEEKKQDAEKIQNGQEEIHCE